MAEKTAAELQEYLKTRVAIDPETGCWKWQGAATKAGYRQRSQTVLSESGLYKLIMRSNRPNARPFQDWVTREVLPAIRKTGTYTMEKGETMPLPADIASAWQEVAKAKMAEALARVAEAEAYSIVAKEEAEKLLPSREALVKGCNVPLFVLMVGAVLRLPTAPESAGNHHQIVFFQL
ncbi:BRO-N domain-containing protein [Oceanibaculum nanhaiense]|uniref:BRO-N domain-containing protein n=1 Tax=Oceanibaculum nanhaiense TaxID=1909734 RepID=UPI000A3602CE|nr:BRO family protein [Oceanibaculum nanhaiense]